MFEIGDKVTIKSKNAYPITDYGSTGTILSKVDNTVIVDFNKVTGCHTMSFPNWIFPIDIKHLCHTDKINKDLFGNII